jgi:hypothetical protein
MIINAITGNALPLRLLANMPVHFGEPVAEHQKFFGRHEGKSNVIM